VLTFMAFKANMEAINEGLEQNGKLGMSLNVLVLREIPEKLFFRRMFLLQ
jgi:hypothetical protein